VLFHGVIRMELVRPLAERGDPRLVDALVHVVNSTPDRRIRQVATHGILKAAQVDQHQVDARTEFLDHSVPARTAPAWLEGRRTPLREKHPLYALARATEDLNERVRAQAVKSLGLIATPDAIEILRDLRDDPSRHVRACVAGALLTAERPLRIRPRTL
jgi:HEAT repeat protein